MSVFNVGLPNQPDKLVYPPTRRILNGFSSGGVSVLNVSASIATNLAKEVLSGALTAGILATVPELVFFGAGRIPILSAYAKDATPRTIRVQVIVDGVVVFDATSNVISAANTGIVAAGTADAVSFGPSEPICYNNSCVIRLASSLSETDKIGVAVRTT